MLAVDGASLVVRAAARGDLAPVRAAAEAVVRSVRLAPALRPPLVTGSYTTGSHASGSYDAGGSFGPAFQFGRIPAGKFQDGRRDVNDMGRRRCHVHRYRN